MKKSFIHIDLIRGCPYIMLSVMIGGGSGKRLCQYSMVGVEAILNYNVNINVKVNKNELCKLNSNADFCQLVFYVMFIHTYFYQF